MNNQQTPKIGHTSSTINTKKPVVIYAPQGIGKTFNSMFYAIDREKEGIVDEWDGETILKNTQLALTNIKPPYNQDVEIINLETAESCGECFGQGSVHDDNFNGLTICPKCLGLRKKLNITSTQE